MKKLSYTVPPEDDGRLIKRVIRGKMGLSHQQFSHAKASRKILLDGEAVFANHIVREGQVIAIHLADDLPSAAPDDGPLDIVYEDDDLIIVAKSAPLPCQCSPKQDGVTLENRMAHRYPDRVFRPVNRLDKGTSGLMVCAAHAHAQLLLSQQLHTDDFVREYLAVVVGFPPERGEIEAPIAKAEGATVKRMVSPTGRRSITRFETVEQGKFNSLVRLRLMTGRTHQIRVHMAHIGHPVYGDFLYGEERPITLPGRFALHSCTVSLIHPLTGERLTFDQPLPDRLHRLIDQA